MIKSAEKPPTIWSDKTLVEVVPSGRICADTDRAINERATEAITPVVMMVELFMRVDQTPKWYLLTNIKGSFEDVNQSP